MIGIYKIQNNENGKIYVGQSINIKRRWQQHKYSLNANKHKNIHLQSAWNKYGKDNFTFEIICSCDIEELDEKEMYYIKQFNSFDCNYGYNMTIGGSGDKQYYDIELIVSTYKKTNSVRKTSIILGISEDKISVILSDLNLRERVSPNRRIVGLSTDDFSVQYEFDSVKEAYDYFESPITNQINKSIKDSKYTAFNCIWFDRCDYIKYQNNIQELLNITKYNNTIRYDSSKEDDYTHNHKTKVICLTTKKIFDSVLDAAIYYEINNENGICYCCSYQRDFCGGLQWMYLDEYEYMIKHDLTIEDMKNKYKPKNVTKKVVCLNNKKIFNAIVEANKYAGLSIYSGKISEACQGKRAMAGKDKEGNPLFWMYYENYITYTDNEISIIIQEYMSKCKSTTKNKFVCLNTNDIFNNVESALKFANLKSRANIYACCHGEKKFAGKHPITKEPLQWMYYTEYIKMRQREVV